MIDKTSTLNTWDEKIICSEKISCVVTILKLFSYKF